MLLTLLLALPRVSFSPSRSLSYFLIIEKTWRLSITIPTFRFYLGQKHPTWAHGRFEKSNFSQQALSNYAFRYRLFPFFNVHKVYSFPSSFSDIAFTVQFTDTTKLFYDEFSISESIISFGKRNEIYIYRNPCQFLLRKRNFPRAFYEVVTKVYRIQTK